MSLQHIIELSVIVPVFNDQQGLDAVLTALRAQTYAAERFEVVVVDNGSSPPMRLPECGSLQARLLQCQIPGSYAARNAGAAAAVGSILAFTDADCIPEPGWLEGGISSLRDANFGAVVGGDVRFIEPRRKTATALYQMIVGFQQRENIEAKGFSATANLFCDRHVFNKIGAFDEALLSGGDREWSARARAIGTPLKYSPAAVVSTLPRTSLSNAIRQARRVTAGRHHLARSQCAHVDHQALAPHRGIKQSALWILGQRNLPPLRRFGVLGVAATIKIATMIESIRLRVGGRPERR